jgi:uncharacterized protein YlxW (UPF0749 family)
MENFEICAAWIVALLLAVLAWLFCLVPAWRRWTQLREEERRRREAEEAQRRAEAKRKRKAAEARRRAEEERERAERERQRAAEVARRKKELEDRIQFLLSSSAAATQAQGWDLVCRLRDEVWDVLRNLDEATEPGRALRQALNRLDDVLKRLRGPLPEVPRGHAIFFDITGRPGVPPWDYTP